MFKPIRHSIPLVLLLPTALMFTVAFTSDASAQYTCQMFLVADCQGEPAITIMFLDEANCIQAFSDAAGVYVSMLKDPDGEAECVNYTGLPVELSSFRATAMVGGVQLAWTTASETDNAGFEIEHRRRSGMFERVAFVSGFGTSRVERTYRYEIAGLEPNVHVFRLKQIDFEGSFSYSSEVEALVTVPDRFMLEPAYPNPFNPSTTVRFAVAIEQRVVLTLADAGGRQVAVLFEGLVSANETKSVLIDGRALSSGSYFVTMRGGAFSKTVAIELVK